MGHLPTHVKEGAPGSSSGRGVRKETAGLIRMSIFFFAGVGGGRWLVGFLEKVLKPGGKSSIPRDV